MSGPTAVATRGTARRARPQPGAAVRRRCGPGRSIRQNFNGMPEGAIVTMLRVNSAFGTIYAAAYGRGAFALDTASIF